MFPLGVYEDWSSKFWQPGYTAAFDLEAKINYQRVLQYEGRNRTSRVNPAMSKLIGNKAAEKRQHCELCNKWLDDPDSFTAHCRRNETHLELKKKFTDETFDFLFKNDPLLELKNQTPQQQQQLPSMKTN